MTKALEVSHVRFGYSKDQIIFDNLNLEVNKSEYVCLIGHNGSGKSTLAKILIGLNEILEGEIKIFGKKLDINDKTIYEIRKDVGIIFQNPDNQFIGTTVRDDIAFGLENNCIPHEDMEDIVLKYAKKVNMIDFLDKEPGNLSGGQKQRVAIAGTLAMNPKLLIMDESTSMLDPKGKREIRELTSELRKENPDLTIISITHDIEEAMQADRVVVINEGKIILNDRPEEVFKHTDELIKIKLDIPFTYKLNEVLNKHKIHVDSKDFEGLVNELCQ